MEHPLMAVAHKLAAEFPGRFLTVLRLVAECAEGNLNRDASLVESAARARLTASIYGELDTEEWRTEHRPRPLVPVPQQRATL